MTPRPRILLVGVSTRGLAESAARAGWRVLACDAFGDRDQQQVARVIALARDPGVGYSAEAVVRAVEAEWGWSGAGTEARLTTQARPTSFAYVSNFENHPDLVARLSEGRSLLGNPAKVLTRVRNPFELSRALSAEGIPCPDVRASAPPSGDRGNWLLKRRRSGGGRGIRRWRRGLPVPRSGYLQERVTGVPCSLVFAADGERVVPFGWSRQLVGDPRFGIAGFGYVGNILCRADDPAVPEGAGAKDRAIRIAEVVTRAFGLIGVNGLDCVVRRGVPFPVEVNPRYSASMELAERALGISVFGLHLAGCRGRLRAEPAIPAAPRRALGKAVAYAPHPITLSDTTHWLHDPSLRDIPASGERINRGQPVCTVFAAGRDSIDCEAALVRRVERLYEEIDRMRESAA